jgi:hypothetical protein
MKPIKAFMILALIVALPALFASSAGAQANFKLDHFKCWTVDQAKQVNDFVLLEDQFDISTNSKEEALVRFPLFFCNPTVKTVSSTAGAQVTTPITNPDAHLKMYLITAHPEPLRSVTVSNQFNDAQNPQVLTVFRPIVLAVPTQKLPHAKPQGLDHFKCYLARGEPVNANVGLQDQFDRQQPEKVKVLRPILFCNPVQKRHDETITEIRNPDDHLTCYIFTPSSTKQIPVQTINQFDREQFFATHSRFLCVPSQKLDFRPIGDTVGGPN